ncbi:MAG: glutamate mutase L [Candidatus Cloacimonadota bacterium]|nr:glutamate mutase L [Candidatus Cloacimonadota bacterium]
MPADIIVTDVGSTTTKAILLKYSLERYRIAAITNYPTTVEKPQEDVNIAIKQAVEELEKQSDTNLIDENGNFNQEVKYYSTSSAGGGLQILVIGLTMFDSASSGKRTAFGAGGVILDTFAIDDKRTALQQMQTMHILHPDIILMAGGIDDGNVSSLLRLAEILQLAKPSPKFGEKNKIPLVFAGNIKAQPFIEGVLKDNFQLEFVPNIRPTMQKENLEPARKKIHHLFMENVMEQAPGYSELKKKTSKPIIPTPLGVIESLKMISNGLDKNLMAVDIGGATTDIFSNILGEYFRTVSANYGMSYSISNVAKDTGFEVLQNLLPSNMSENYIRNYISNKMLYPTYIPQDQFQVSIEHAIAKSAIKLSRKQHFQMNFNTEEIGFLDDLKQTMLDEKINETFYFEKASEKLKFKMEDIDILLGSGGVISHAQENKQVLEIMNTGFEPKGITEIWKDRNFLSPHMGILSYADKELASQLLLNECIEKIGIIIRPFGKKWRPNKTILTIQIGENSPEKITTGEVKYFSINSNTNIKINMHNGFQIEGEDEIEFETPLPILINGNFANTTNYISENKRPVGFQEPKPIETFFLDFIPSKKIEKGKLTRKIELPYPGEILVKKGDEVKPGDVIGQNIYDPPKVYIITLFDKIHLKISKKNIKKSLKIKEGDEVKIGQRIVEIKRKNLLEKMNIQNYIYDSPVRGKVEKINYDAGTIILREIQDYSTKPVKIKVAKKMKIDPKKMKQYLKVKKGNFVYAGDILASKLMKIFSNSEAAESFTFSIQAPSTGTIKDIDYETGTITIKYDKKPFKKTAHLKGIITDVIPKNAAILEFKGSRLQGIIGFGSENSGKLHYFEDLSELNNCTDNEIAVYPGQVDLAFLKMAAKLKLKGVVAGSINNKDLTEFIADEIGVALTGNEKIDFPFIITEGFGSFDMCQNYKKFLAENNGKWTYINGHTQIRAGVTRPTIIVAEL